MGNRNSRRGVEPGAPRLGNGRVARPSLPAVAPAENPCDPRSDKTNQSGRSRSSFRQLFASKWADPVTWFTGALMLFSGLQAWSFVVSERAIITVDEPKFVGTAPFANKPLKFIIKITNSGKSTATFENMQVNLRLAAGQPIPEHPKLSDLTSLAAAPTPPGSTQTILFEPAVNDRPVALTQEQVDKIEKGEVLMYLYGRVLYADEFTSIARNKEVGFCFFYRADLAQFGAAFMTCKERNYTYAK
jgi:hypothetical protein